MSPATSPASNSKNSKALVWTFALLAVSLAGCADAPTSSDDAQDGGAETQDPAGPPGTETGNQTVTPGADNETAPADEFVLPSNVTEWAWTAAGNTSQAFRFAIHVPQQTFCQDEWSISIQGAEGSNGGFVRDDRASASGAIGAQVMGQRQELDARYEAGGSGSISRSQGQAEYALFAMPVDGDPDGTWTMELSLTCDVAFDVIRAEQAPAWAVLDLLDMESDTAASGNFAGYTTTGSGIEFDVGANSTAWLYTSSINNAEWTLETPEKTDTFQGGVGDIMHNPTGPTGPWRVSFTGSGAYSSSVWCAVAGEFEPFDPSA